MKITRIDKSNERFFEPFLLEAAERRGENILRLGAIEDGVACGAAAFEVNKSTVELMSLFVAPAYRRRGAGRALLDAVSALADGTDSQSLIVSFIPEKNDGLTDFFEAAGFALFGGSPELTVDFEEAKNAESLRKYMQKADYSGVAFSLDELSPTQKHQLDSLLQGYGVSLAEVATGSCEPALSFAYFKNGSLVAGMFCSVPGDQLSIDFLFSRVSTAGPTLTIIEQIERRLADWPTEIRRIAFLAVNPVAPAIAHELFGSAVHKTAAAAFGVKLLKPAARVAD